MRTVNKELAIKTQDKHEVKTVFSQNAKMRKSSGDGIHVYNWGIPAFKSADGTLTCPNATKCVAGCYAKMGAYVWSNVAKAYEGRLALSKDVNFTEVIKHNIDKLINKHKDGTILIRIHDSGDFYSKEYYEQWKSIALHYKANKRIKFYAYSKMVSMLKDDKRPDNFSIIFSFGGKEDKLINVKKDRHSRVFESSEELEAAGYVNASDDDMLALTKNNKVGLVYHGNKSYKKTSWDKVA
jgi:hypothetical protein